MSFFKQSLPAVVLLTAIFFLNFLTRTIMAPLLVHLEQAFGLNHTAATGLLAYQSAGLSVSLFCSGILAGYLPHRRVVALSVIGSGLALCLLSLASGIWSARAGFTLVGCATGLYLASGIAMLSDATQKEHWGKAIAIHELAPNLAFVCSPILIETALHFTNWQGAILITGVLCIVGGGLFLRYAKGGNFTGIRPTTHTFPALIALKATWAFAIIATVASVLESSPYNVMPLFLVSERGMNTIEAGSLISISRLITPVLPLAGGWLVDRFHYKPVLFCCLFISAVAMVGVATTHNSLLTISLILQSGMPALMFPAVFAALAHAFTPREQALVLSLTMPFIAGISTGIVPFFLGFCGDTVGFGKGFLVIAFFCLISTLAPRYLTPDYAKLSQPLENKS